MAPAEATSPIDAEAVRQTRRVRARRLIKTIRLWWVAAVVVYLAIGLADDRDRSGLREVFRDFPVIMWSAFAFGLSCILAGITSIVVVVRYRSVLPRREIRTGVAPAPLTAAMFSAITAYLLVKHG